MPVLVGSKYQRGHGLGNILGGLFPRVIGFSGGKGVQFLKQNRGSAVSNLIQTSFKVADDLSRGKKIKESLKE